MITQEQIQKLARLRDPEYPVTSLFLNLNGGRDARKSSILLKDLLKTKRSTIDGLGKEQSRSVARDFDQIERFVQGFDRKGTRALAIFSSAGASLWEVFPLARRVQDRLVIDIHPHIRPLSRLLNECKRCGVVLLSRDRAAINLIHLGESQQLEVLSGDVLPQVRESGFQGYLERRIERHVDDQMQRFIKIVAARVLEHHKEHKFDYIVVGGSADPVAAFETVAHRYVTEKLIGRVGFGPDASGRQVLGEISEIVLTHEEMRGLQLMQRIDSEAQGIGLGTIGIEPTLRAINDGRVAALVVLKGALRPGSACPECSYLGARTGACPHCETDLLPVPDVIEEAVDRSMAQKAEVFFVGAHDLLAVQGGLAALLRY